MTKTKIMQEIKENNTNSYIKWSVVENTPKRVVLTNNYDEGINYSIEIKCDGVDEWISVRDNMQGCLVAGLIKGIRRYDDYEETEQGLLKGIAIAVHNFNYYY